MSVNKAPNKNKPTKVETWKLGTGYFGQVQWDADWFFEFGLIFDFRFSPNEQSNQWTLFLLRTSYGDHLFRMNPIVSINVILG